MNEEKPKCRRCERNAVFTVVEDMERIPLCLMHYKLNESVALDENLGVAM